MLRFARLPSAVPGRSLVPRGKPSSLWVASSGPPLAALPPSSRGAPVPGIAALLSPGALQHRCAGIVASEHLAKAATPVAVRAFSTKAAKRPTDPEKPKRPLGPYFRFLADFRTRHPDLKKEAVSKAAIAWKGLSDVEKRPFVSPYESEMTIYKEATSKYESSGKKDAWRRDPERPKVPMTGFLRFALEYRSKHSGLKVTESTKQASAEWKLMTAEKRQPYEQAYKTEKEKYSAALEAYKKSGKEGAWKERVGISELEARKAEKLAKQQEKKQKLAEQKKAASEKKKQAAAKKKEELAKKREKSIAKKKALAEKQAEAKKKEKEKEKKKKEKKGTAASK